ncbi:hypothetical protein [Coralliovum pocilloporae]|uniref:hypothetical protein n=1 Tax=Coralliovum pocilloporae TaxID=3066369 RepID=UPI003306E335
MRAVYGGHLSVLLLALACVLLLGGATVIPNPADGADKDTSRLKQLETMFKAEQQSGKASGRQNSGAGQGVSESEKGPNPEILFPNLPQNFKPDAETLAAVQAAVKGYYDYRERAYRHRQDVFSWQHLSSRIIFFVVIIIVLAGLYFSWMQFHVDKDRESRETTTLEASQTGIKVSSPVLGVIILVLSLAFFYLYLVHVYPIADTF